MGLDPAPTIPSRPWRAIARELTIEENHERFAELATELDRALEEQLGNQASSLLKPKKAPQAHSTGNS